MADRIYQPGIGPTSNTDAEDALDAEVPNPDVICEVGTIEHFMSSKLYPVDVIDAMVFGVSITGGALSALPSDDAQSNVDFVSAYWYQARWFYTDGPYEDQAYSSVDFASGYWYQARWFYVDGPYDDEAYSSVDFVSAYYDNKKVEADTPDSLLLLSCSINASCSMTGI